MINSTKARPAMADQGDRKPCKYPSTGTLRAEVLAVLLASEDMAGMESIFAHGGHSVNTVIRALVRKCHWPIERQDGPVNIGDGRSGWASTWSLSQEVIDAALDAGGREWLEGVRVMRAVRARRLATLLSGQRAAK